MNYDKDQEVENLTFENDDEESDVNSNYQQSLLNQDEQSEVKDENPYETEFNEPIEVDKPTEHLAESRNYQHLQADTLPKEENLASVTRQKNPYKNIMIAVILLSLGLTWINRRMLAGLFIQNFE